MPKYSIIIPVFNAERYLHQCLDSILSQSHNDFEVILVNDGSKDFSGAICDEYVKKDSRIKVIHKVNEGVSVARNVGIEESRGEWISFVDADDLVSSDYLETFDEIEQKSDLTYFGNEWLSADGCNKTYYLPSKRYVGWENIQEGMMLLKQNDAQYDYYGFTWNKFFRADIICKHNVRFVPGVTMKEDELFVDDYIVHCHSLMLLPEVLYRYRWTKGGLTVSYKSSECLSLYANHAENILSKLTNMVLRQHQINFIFFNKYQVFERLSNPKEILITLDELLRFVRQYRKECYNNVGYYDIQKWSIWNYYKDSSAESYIKRKRLKKKIKEVMGFEH